jgi:Peptidase family M41
VIDQREAIAYHEAGHAVISMKLGYRCLYVTIIPDGDRLGHVCCEDPLVVGHDDKIKHALKVLIAASLAESKHIGCRTVGYDRIAVCTWSRGNRQPSFSDVVGCCRERRPWRRKVWSLTPPEKVEKHASRRNHSR